jgi:putative heme-binding domain-containing protein
LKLALAIALAGPFLTALTAQDNKADTSLQKNPFAGDAQAIEWGRVKFRMSCAGCHGLRATGGRSGPDLTRGTFAAGDQDSDLYGVIAKGVPGTEMPGFSDSLETDEVWRLVSYVRSLTSRGAAPIAGDAAAGEALFWGKGGCGRCHRVGTRGSSVGPSLTRAGAQRSLAYLRESVLAPDADITYGYATITVVTRDGRKIVGVERGFDNFSAQLIDVSGRYYSLQKDDVTSIQREYRSLMPLNYGRLFSEAELTDLLAFLASLRGGPP